MDLLLLSLGPQEYGKSLPESRPGFCTPEGDIPGAEGHGKRTSHIVTPEQRGFEGC